MPAGDCSRLHGPHSHPSPRDYSRGELPSGTVQAWMHYALRKCPRQVIHVAAEVRTAVVLTMYDSELVNNQEVILAWIIAQQPNAIPGDGAVGASAFHVDDVTEHAMEVAIIDNQRGRLGMQHLPQRFGTGSRREVRVKSIDGLAQPSHHSATSSISISASAEMAPQQRPCRGIRSRHGNGWRPAVSPSAVRFPSSPHPVHCPMSSASDSTRFRKPTTSCRLTGP
jgi:hypothetical protein